MVSNRVGRAGFTAKSVSRENGEYYGEEYGDDVTQDEQVVSKSSGQEKQECIEIDELARISTSLLSHPRQLRIRIKNY